MQNTFPDVHTCSIFLGIIATGCQCKFLVYFSQSSPIRRWVDICFIHREKKERNRHFTYSEESVDCHYSRKKSFTHFLVQHSSCLSVHISFKSCICKDSEKVPYEEKFAAPAILYSNMVSQKCMWILLRQ